MNEPTTQPASPVTDDAWDAYNRRACGLHYIAHKMRSMEVALRRVLASAMPNARDNPSMAKAWQEAEAVLNTPNAQGSPTAPGTEEDNSHE